MGYDYIDHGRATPFVPASITFPKKKAKQLRGMVEDVSLSLAQQTIAKALGWKDWFALDSAIKAGSQPSAPDEEVSEEERLKRWSTQFNAIHEELNLRLPDPEYIVAELGLTCSAATAKRRLDDIGPWGAFQELPAELAPGILYGQCAKFACYRLSQERQLQIKEHWRLDTNGWYMEADHGWRIILSFPQLFSAKERNKALIDMGEMQPFLYEIETGDSTSAAMFLRPNLATRKRKALANPESWFALSHFPEWSLPGVGFGNSSRTVVSAIKGNDLVRLIDAKGIWPADDSIQVAWFATDIGEFQERCRIGPDGAHTDATCLNGMPAYRHTPVSALPYKESPFALRELDPVCCVGYSALVEAFADGTLTPIV